MADEQNAWFNKLESIIALAPYQGNNLIRIFDIRGENTDIDTATTPEDVISQGGLQYYPAVGAETTIVSSSAEDTLTTGTGAWYVTVTGLLDGWIEASETVEMNGTNAVTLTNQFKRINKMEIGQCGSNNLNVGTIQAKHGANVLSEIQFQHGVSQNAVYTVPAGYTGYIFYFSGGVSDDQSGQYADFHLYKRSNEAPVTGWQVVFDNIIIQGNPQEANIHGVTVRPGDDIVVRIVVVSSNDIRVFADIGFMLIPD